MYLAHYMDYTRISRYSCRHWNLWRAGKHKCLAIYTFQTTFHEEPSIYGMIIKLGWGTDLPSAI